MSRACHHPNDLVHVTYGTKEVSHIVGIVNHLQHTRINLKHEFVLDERLLKRVLTTCIFIVKSISLRRRLAFSQALKKILYKVTVESRLVGA